MDLHKDHLEYHRSLESQMTVGFQELNRAFQGSRNDMMDEIKRILADQQLATDSSRVNLLSGYQDLTQSLNRVSYNIIEAQGENGAMLASKMEDVLMEQHRATVALLKADTQNSNIAMHTQLCLLVS
jgi:hypothetical protein